VTPADVQTLIEEATFDYTMGEPDAALAKLAHATTVAPPPSRPGTRSPRSTSPCAASTPPSSPPTAPSPSGPDDLFINTTLSRIWMEKGDKATAEKYGAQAKILSWKEQLKNPEAAKEGILNWKRDFTPDPNARHPFANRGIIPTSPSFWTVIARSGATKQSSWIATARFAGLAMTKG
jgi:hypothetical protein